MKRKIVYCIQSLYNGRGMERVTTLKANYFASSGKYDVTIIITDGRDKKPFFELHPSISVIDLGINYDYLNDLPIHKKVLGYYSKQKKYKKELTAILNKIKPDITVSLLRREINFLYKINDGSIKIGEFHFSRFFYRNMSESSLPQSIKKVISNLWMGQLIHALKRIDKFVVLTKEDAANWKELDNVAVIENPFSFTPHGVSNCESQKLIAVGALVPQKRFDFLIDCWSEVVKKHPDWTLRIYGDGMLREELQNQINKLSLNNSCFLEHSTSNIIDKYIESSCFVLSSEYEGFPMVLTEAMICGLPVVSLACPCGPKDIINDGIDGFLVENNNQKELAEKISYIIENEPMRIKMGKAAQVNIQRFSINNIGKKWEDLFDETIAKR